MVTKKLTKEIIQKIRKEIKDGKSKYKTAMEYGINPKAVYRLTQDIPGNQFGWPGIMGKTLKLLQDIMQHGYILSTKIQAGDKYHTLKKYFPNISRINMYNKSILFLNDKTPAARAFLFDMNKKIMSFQELKQITKTFGIELTSEEKHKIVGKNCKHVLPITSGKDGGFIGKKESRPSSKNHVSENDYILENDDSLAFFYIRKY